MNNELVPQKPKDTALVPITQKAKEYVRDSRAASTRKTYRQAWDSFCAWCKVHHLESFPATPETVSLYISDMAENKKPSTITKHVAAISVAHQFKNHKPPTRTTLVRATLQGIKRTKGIAKTKKAPVRVIHLWHLSEVLPKNLRGVRDKAIFLVGYAGAFRRSELVAVNVEDLTFVEEGVRIRVRRSKTDQEGKGHIKDIGYAINAANCPVKALKKWLEESGITEGAVFRSVNRGGNICNERLSNQSVALVVKEVMKALGCDPDEFSGHSLRAGMVTDSLKQGIQTQIIRQVTGHRSESTLAEYIREADTFGYKITEKLGL